VNGKDYTTAIRNQAGCGSCVAFGTIGSIEPRMEIGLARPALNPNLSEDQLFDCGGGDCGPGWYVNAALDFATNPGIVDEACQPYDDSDQLCEPCSDWESRVMKLTGYEYLYDPDQMKEAIATRGPVVATFTVYEDFFSYTGGIYRYQWGEVAGGHAVAIVGYNDAEGYWIAKNSWGPGWGEAGWFRIAYGEVGIDYLFYEPLMDFPYEPNNSLDNPAWIAAGWGVDAAIDVPGDQDYYAFEGEAGEEIIADIDAAVNGSYLDSKLYLYDANGNQIAYNDDDGSTLDSYFRVTLPATGRYTLFVTSYYDPNQGGSNHFYTLRLISLGSEQAVFVSAAKAGTVAGIAYAPADILRYDQETGTWSMFFDASDVGITKNVDAFDIQEDNYWLTLSLQDSQTVVGIGTVKPQDVFYFNPTSLGANTAGSFSRYLRGADYGLTTAAENVDAITQYPWGVLFSTTGNLSVPSIWEPGVLIKAKDEDLVWYDDYLPDLSLEFDGSRIPGLAAEDVTAADYYAGHLFLTIAGSGVIDGHTYNQKTIFTVDMDTYDVLGSYWSGSAHGFKGNIDGLEVRGGW
jgi:hypothetical protein